MAQFDERKLNLLKILYNSSFCVTGKSISLELGCSLRTTQAEISAINHIVPQLILSDNKGYRLNSSVCDSLQIDLSDSAENDEHVILRKLLLADEKGGSRQIDELAEDLYMSTPTLEKKLKKIIPLLSEFNLELQRKKAHLSIKGSESDKRSLIQYLILEESNTRFNDLGRLDKYFPDFDIERLKSIVLNAIHKYDYFLESAYSSNVFVNISIALFRMRTDNYIVRPYSISFKTHDAELLIAEEICRQYADHWNITPTSFDISYIASLLSGQIKPLTNSVQTGSGYIISPEFVTRINNILVSTFNEYLLNVDISGILYNFALHIDSLIKRSHLKSSLSSEILDTMKRNTPFIYDVAVSIAQHIQDEFDITVTDAEIGYICIHIGYLIEQSVESSEKVYILLLGDDYHHIGDMIADKLRTSFSELIELQIINSFENLNLCDIKADLILTTKPLSVLRPNILTISPIYNIMDHIRIDQAIHSCLDEKKKRLQDQLLLSFFNEQLFFVEDHFKDKESVIRFLGQKIVDFGITTGDFIASVLKREALSSTCFYETFAIPHAADVTAEKTMVCVLISRHGIMWDNHRIHIVMMIAVNQQERKQFMQIYNGIVQALKLPHTIHQLSEVSDFAEFTEVLKKG